MSNGGCSNYDIFHTLIKNIDKINNDDIIIIGWTQMIRFRIASKRNDFYNVMVAVVDQMNHLIDVPSQSLIDITLNRSNNSIYYDELTDYIKIINKSLPNNKIINWTWVKPTFNDENEKKFYELLIPYKDYKTVRQETNGDVDDFHYGEVGHNELSQDLIKFL